LNDYHVLFIDEVGDWKEPLYIIGGLIFNLCDFWEITTEIRKAKKEILGKNPYEEFKWNKFTDVANGKIENISKENAKKYMEISANIIKNKSEVFLSAVVELEKVILWDKWKNSKQKKAKAENKKKLENWIREKCMESLIERYQYWLKEKNDLGLIIIDRYQGEEKYAKFEKEHIGILTSLIYDGNKYRENFCNIFPPLFANSEFCALFDINDYGLGAFSYVIKQLYKKNKIPNYFETTLKLYQLVLDKVRKSKDGKMWGYGLIDIPKDVEPSLRNVINEDMLYSVIKE